MLQVEHSKRTGSDLDVQVFFQLQASLLQAIAAEELQEMSVEQVLANLGCDLAPAVVLAVEPAPVDDLLSVPFVSPQTLESSGHRQSQELCDLLEGLLCVVVQLVDLVGFVLGDLPALWSRRFWKLLDSLPYT